MPSAPIPAVTGASLFILSSRPGHSHWLLWTVSTSGVQGFVHPSSRTVGEWNELGTDPGKQGLGTEMVFSELRFPWYEGEILLMPAGQGLGGNWVSYCETEGLAGPCHQPLGTLFFFSRPFFLISDTENNVTHWGFWSSPGLWIRQYTVKWSHYWKRPCCWERLKVKEEGVNRGGDGGVAVLTQQTWVWANSRR